MVQPIAFLLTQLGTVCRANALRNSGSGQHGESGYSIYPAVRGRYKINPVYGETLGTVKPANDGDNALWLGYRVRIAGKITRGTQTERRND